MIKQGSKAHLVFTHPICWIGFGFGVGLLPYAPGTWGTVVGVLLYVLLQTLPLYTYSVVLWFATVAGIWICSITEQKIGLSDDPGIVWDEICGYGLTMLAAPLGIVWIVLGFFLFRIFDVWKPWPIRQIDRTIKGGLGIMLDDILAGIYACISMKIIQVIWAQYIAC